MQCDSIGVHVEQRVSDLATIVTDFGRRLERMETLLFLSDFKDFYKLDELIRQVKREASCSNVCAAQPDPEDPPVKQVLVLADDTDTDDFGALNHTRATVAPATTVADAPEVENTAKMQPQYSKARKRRSARFQDATAPVVSIGCTAQPDPDDAPVKQVQTPAGNGGGVKSAPPSMPGISAKTSAKVDPATKVADLAGVEMAAKMQPPYIKARRRRSPQFQDVTVPVVSGPGTNGKGADRVDNVHRVCGSQRSEGSSFSESWLAGIFRPHDAKTTNVEDSSDNEEELATCASGNTLKAGQNKAISKTQRARESGTAGFVAASKVTHAEDHAAKQLMNQDIDDPEDEMRVTMEADVQVFLAQQFLAAGRLVQASTTKADTNRKAKS